MLVLRFFVNLAILLAVTVRGQMLINALHVLILLIESSKALLRPLKVLVKYVISTLPPNQAITQAQILISACHATLPVEGAQEETILIVSHATIRHKVFLLPV